MPTVEGHSDLGTSSATISKEQTMLSSSSELATYTTLGTTASILSSLSTTADSTMTTSLATDQASSIAATTTADASAATQLPFPISELESIVPFVALVIASRY